MGSVSALALLAVPVHAQNYEYSPTFQPNLDQIMVTRELHEQLAEIFSSSSKQGEILDTGIAILDGRADDRHADLTDNTTVTFVYSGRYRYDDHGTHVTGIAGAAVNDVGIVGVNPFARLLNIPVFDNRGWAATDLGKAALDTAVNQGAKAANMSYGPIAAGVVFLNGELDLFTDYLSSLVLVRAAGNDGVDALSAHFTGVANRDLAHLLIVGSVDAKNRISSFSTRPGRACISTRELCGRNNPNAMMNFFILAPGESIVSDLPRNKYGTMSGTSMAAPHVAGAAALVYQRALAGNTDLTPGEIASILKESATRRGKMQPNRNHGWGLLNVEAALAPVGGTFVATGETVGSGLMPTSGSMLKNASVLGNSARLGSALSGMVLFDRYKRAFVFDEVPLPSPSSHHLERSLHELVAGLGERRDEVDHGGVAMSLVRSGNAVDREGYTAMSVTGDGAGFQAGFGMARNYFGGAASDRAMGSGSSALATEFFAGSGDVGKGLAQAMFAGADWDVSQRLSVSALLLQSTPLELLAGFDPLAQFEADPATSSLVRLGLRYRLNDVVSLGASYSLLDEQGRVLGMESAGGLSLGDRAQTQLFGASLRAQISPMAALALFSEISVTSSSLNQPSLFSEVEGWQGSKFGLSFEWRSLLASNDLVRLTVARPWTLDGGKVSARVPVGRELDGTVNYEDRRVSLASGEMPLELSVGYQSRTGQLSYGAGLTMFSDNVRAGATPDLAVTGALRWTF